MKSILAWDLLPLPKEDPPLLLTWLGNFLVKKVCCFEKTLPFQKFPVLSEIWCHLAKLGRLDGPGWQVEMGSKTGSLPLSKKSAVSKKSLPLPKKLAALASKKLPSYLTMYLYIVVAIF